MQVVPHISGGLELVIDARAIFHINNDNFVPSSDSGQCHCFDIVIEGRGSGAAVVLAIDNTGQDDGDSLVKAIDLIQDIGNIIRTRV